MVAQIGIFSLEGDLHAHAVKHELNKLGVQTHFFATDSQINDGGLVWSLRSGGILTNYEREQVQISDLSLVWWRRVNQPQKDSHKFNNFVEFDLACNEWKGALFGAVSDSFRGVWVNHPKNDVLAGNKIYHLNVAKNIGLRIPDTLVTNDIHSAIEFCNKHNDKVIVKKIQGGANLSLATLEISAKNLKDASISLSVCPVMLQEKINANGHIRANCFGNKVFSVKIDSNDLDWRRNLNCEFKEYKLPKTLSDKLIDLLKGLGLEMGIMDLILSDEGVVWLEINPQGQFLFAEGLSGLNLKTPCAEFLRDLALESANKSLNPTA